MIVTLADLPMIHLNPHPAFWFLLPVFPVAGVLIFLLYFQQRRLAATWTVLTLTVLRLLLLVMLAVLFLRPAGQWKHTTTSAGTLWFLVDQSPSMQAPDPQAGVAERLRWAEALGYFPPKGRQHELDIRQGETLAVQAAFAGLRPPTSLTTGAKEDADDLARAGEFSRAFGAWVRKLDALKTALDKDPALRGGVGASARDAIERAASLAHAGAQGAKSSPTLARAVDAVNWSLIEENLRRVAADLGTAAAAADAEFVRAHATDANVVAALDRVTNVPRAELAYEFLTAASRRGGRSPSDLLPKYRVRVASFSDSAQATGTIDPANFPDILRAALAPANAPGAASGQATSISAGLQMIAEQIGPDEPASIIVVTDGRHNLPGDPTEPARLLAARSTSANVRDQVRVFGLLVGSHAVSPDAAVDQVEAPQWVFRGDTLHASALVRLEGLNGGTARVEFRRLSAGSASGTLIDTQNVPATSEQMVRRIDFTDRPPQDLEGGIEYEVRVVEMPGEVNVENNRSGFRVTIKKDRLYALVIEDHPRWEYRYVASLLDNDPRLKVQTILLDPAEITGVGAPAPVKASPANPRIEAQILPQTREEWQAFDLIILGDIPPSTLSNAQQQFIAAAVRDKGTTLITIAGERYMPEAYANTPLADLLPVTLVPQFDNATIVRHRRYGFRPGLAQEGSGSPLGQLGDVSSGGGASNFWFNVPEWYWHSPFTQVKPSAAAIWSITEPARNAAPEPEGAPVGSLAQSRKSALLSTMAVGAGKTMHLASDQTWRLRQVYGINAQERFWRNVLGWAVGSDLPAGGKFVRFGSSQPRYPEGQPVEITARVLQENLVPYTNLTFSAVARPVSKGGPAPPADAGHQARFVETETPGYYRAMIAGLPPGDYEIALQGIEVEHLLDIDPTVTQRTLPVKIVPQLNLERRNMNTDPLLLARVAQAGGGFSLDANYADLLAANLPEIERTQTSTEEIGFFTDPSARGTRIAHWTFLALFALLLTIEWIIRKLAGLV